jgi:flagellar motor switch protein FliM
MTDVIEQLLKSLKGGWAKITDLMPNINHMDTNPQYLNAAPPAEMTLLVTLGAKFGDAEGIINILVPYIWR